MNILQLAKYYPPARGGIELVTEFFSRALIELGHTVNIVSVNEESKNYIGTYGEKVFQCHEDIKLRSSPISLGYLRQFKHAALDGNLDYIYVHLPNPFAHELIKLFSSVINEKKIRVIGIYHSDIVNQVTLRDTYNFYFKHSSHHYYQFYCSSQNLRNSSLILSELPENKVKIIPFCSDHSFKATKAGCKQFQGKFVTVGRLVPYKGFEFLINCFRELPFELTIVGEGPLKNKLSSYCPSNVHFVGEVSEADKYNIFSNSDALIVSSINRAEAYGMTIVEAFSVGLPVISSDIDTGVTYLVQEQLTGLVFPILNSQVFIEKIIEFSKNLELRHKLASNCYDFYLKNLSYDIFKRNISNLLAEERG